MQDVAIFTARRTPITEVHGELSGWHPVELLAHVLHSTLRAAELSPTDVDAIVVGCAMPVGAQSHNVARAASLVLGWPTGIRAHMVEAGSASGHQALLDAVAAVRSEAATCVIAAAVEVMSLVPDGASALDRNYGKVWGEQLRSRFAAEMQPPSLTADRWCRTHAVPAADLHNALATRQNLPPALALVPTNVVRRDAGTVLDERRLITTDFRRKLSTDELAPLFASDGLFTADMVASMGDGAAAVVVRRASIGGVNGLHIGSTDYCGTDPYVQPFAAVDAAEKALERQLSEVVSVDESNALVALEVDRRFGPATVVRSALTGARPTSVSDLAAVVDLANGEAESGVIASDLGLGLGIATTFTRR